MEKDVVREICKDLNWMEKIIVKVFKKLFISTYKKGVRTGFNW